MCRLPEESAKFYAAEVLLALEYLHKQNIVYRDLKVNSQRVVSSMTGHFQWHCTGCLSV